MKACRLTDNGLALVDVPKPGVDGEAIVRVLLSGICGTDLELLKGYSGFHGTIGHEFVGIVEDARGEPGLVGKRVVGEINAGCGRCELCLLGDARHCPDRTVLGIKGRDGAHAEYLRLPSVNLLEVPDNVADTEAVFTEPLAAAIGITERVDIDPAARVAVVGDGRLGLLCAMALALSGRAVTLFGRHRSKLAIAEGYSVETGISAEGRQPGREFDVVVEASGSKLGLSEAAAMVKPRGTIVLKSTFQGDGAWDSSQIVVDEIAVVGSRCGRFRPALDMLAAKLIDTSQLINSEYALTDAHRAFERAREPGVLKVLLRP